MGHHNQDKKNKFFFIFCVYGIHFSGLYFYFVDDLCGKLMTWMGNWYRTKIFDRCVCWVIRRLKNGVSIYCLIKMSMLSMSILAGSRELESHLTGLESTFRGGSDLGTSQLDRRSKTFSHTWIYSRDLDVVAYRKLYFFLANTLRWLNVVMLSHSMVHLLSLE